MRPVRPAHVIALVLCLALAFPLVVVAQTIDRSQVEAIEARVAELRNLQLETDVPVVDIDRAEFVDELRAQAATLEAAAQTAATQKLLRLLGLLSPNVDLADVQVEVLGAQVLGLYDPEDQQIGVLDAGPLDAQDKVTLAHEFTHALQDQNFHLDTLTFQEPRNSDRDLAILALVEGDATLTSRIFAQLSLSEAELHQLLTPINTEALDMPDFPDVLQQELRFVYLDGAYFAQDLLATGGWEAVNAAYQDLPQSTEQVLHPTKYLFEEAPSIPSLGNAAAALGPEWHMLLEDTMGELDLQIGLRQFVPILRADQAAAGWGGDRFQLLERADDGFLALVLRSNWDTSGDAQEFFAAYADLIKTRFAGKAVPLQQKPGLLAWSTPEGVVWLQVSENQVVVVYGPEPRHAQTLAGLVGGG